MLTNGKGGIVLSCILLALRSLSIQESDGGGGARLVGTHIKQPKHGAIWGPTAIALQRSTWD